jgi:hypothetical protein
VRIFALSTRSVIFIIMLWKAWMDVLGPVRMGGAPTSARMWTPGLLPGTSTASIGG